MTTQDELAIRYEKEMKDSQQTADNTKHWKIVEDKHNGIVYTEGNDEIGWKFCYVDKTLLDQLKSEAFLSFASSEEAKQLRRDAIQSQEAEDYFWNQTTGKSKLALMLDKVRRDAKEELKQEWILATTKSPMSLLIDIMIETEVKKAKKELLDEIEMEIARINTVDLYKQNIITIIRNVRAKTLGEQVNTK